MITMIIVIARVTAVMIVDAVKKGDSFGVKVDKPTKPGTEVYLV